MLCPWRPPFRLKPGPTSPSSLPGVAARLHPSILVQGDPEVQPDGLPRGLELSARCSFLWTRVLARSRWTPSRFTISPSSPRPMSYFPGDARRCGQVQLGARLESRLDEGHTSVTRPPLWTEAPARREGVGPAAAGTSPGRPALMW